MTQSALLTVARVDKRRHALEHAESETQYNEKNKRLGESNPSRIIFVCKFSSRTNAFPRGEGFGAKGKRHQKTVFCNASPYNETGKFCIMRQSELFCCERLLFASVCGIIVQKGTVWLLFDPPCWCTETVFVPSFILCF